MQFTWNKLAPQSIKSNISIETQYQLSCGVSSDINEHLPTLYKYALRCAHITECGVRNVVSSYAFANALKDRHTNKLIQVDTVKSKDVSNFMLLCNSEGITNVFYEQSDLECPIEDTELLFIDTWHVYGQLKRELARWHSAVSKYIILHDTTVDEFVGETIRMKYNGHKQSEETGIPIDEIHKGLWPAIEEFLEAHPEWTIKERFTNNNGLTILERKPKIAFITAIYGGYETSCKLFLPQTIPTDFICFTDNPNLKSNGWDIDTHPYHITHKSHLDNGTCLNSYENTKHTFILAKYYKQGFQNIPKLKDYDVVVWVDGSIRIQNERTSKYVFDNIIEHKVMLFEHSWRDGSLYSESKAGDFPRYTSTFWNNQSQPFQDVFKQYQLYINDGYDETYFKSRVPNRPHIGIWVTCFIGWNNKDRIVKKFLDKWYSETLNVCSHEQVSFSYVSQKLDIIPYTLPDSNIRGTFESNDFYSKLAHGE
jgi:hypothetical protein